MALDSRFFLRTAVTSHKDSTLESYKAVYARSTMVLFSRKTRTPLAALTLCAEDVGCLAMTTSRPSPQDVVESYFQGMLSMPEQNFTFTISNLSEKGMINFNILHTPHRVSSVDPGPSYGVNQVNELHTNESCTVEADQRNNCKMILAGMTKTIPDADTKELKKVEVTVKESESQAKPTGLYFYLSVAPDKACKALVDQFAEGTTWKAVPCFVRRLLQKPTPLLPNYKTDARGLPDYKDQVRSRAPDHPALDATPSLSSNEKNSARGSFPYELPDYKDQVRSRAPEPPALDATPSLSPNEKNSALGSFPYELPDYKDQVRSNTRAARRASPRAAHRAVAAALRESTVSAPDKQYLAPGPLPHGLPDYKDQVRSNSCRSAQQVSTVPQASSSKTRTDWFRPCSRALTSILGLSAALVAIPLIAVIAIPLIPVIVCLIKPNMGMAAGGPQDMKAPMSCAAPEDEFSETPPATPSPNRHHARTPDSHYYPTDSSRSDEDYIHLHHPLAVAPAPFQKSGGGWSALDTVQSHEDHRHDSVGELSTGSGRSRDPSGVPADVASPPYASPVASLRNTGRYLPQQKDQCRTRAGEGSLSPKDQPRDTYFPKFKGHAPACPHTASRARRDPPTSEESSYVQDDLGPEEVMDYLGLEGARTRDSGRLTEKVDVGKTQATELQCGTKVEVYSRSTGHDYDYGHCSESTVLCMSIWKDMKFLPLPNLEKKLVEEVAEWVQNEGKVLIEALNAVYKTDTCVIDLESEADTIICNCGHQCIHHSNIYSSLRECPVCRSYITAFVRADGIMVQ